MKGYTFLLCQKKCTEAEALDSIFPYLTFDVTKAAVFCGGNAWDRELADVPRWPPSVWDKEKAPVPPAKVCWTFVGQDMVT